jgi:hypothetical protein
MAAGILSGMEGKLNTRGWRWWVISMFFNDLFKNSSITQAILY